MKRTPPLLLTFAFSAFCLAAGHAAVVTYDITTPATAVTAISGTPLPGVTALDLTRGSGLLAAGATNSFSATGWNDLTVDDYYSFGFTVGSGVEVTLTTIDFTYTSSNTGPANIVLRSSVDGFASALGTYTSANAATGYSINVSALGVLTSGVEFRVYAADSVAVNGAAVLAAGTSRFRNSLVINGTAVPEPASALLGALGFLAILRRRR